jgi:hypothetical protein
MTGWLARALSLLWFATATVLLLAVAYLAALVVDAIQISSPTLLSGDTCAPRHGLALITVPASEPAVCEWEPVASKARQDRMVILQISEMENGRFRADATVTTSLTDPIVAKVQHGDARQDAEAFAGIVIGFVDADQPLEWSVPVLKKGPSPGKVLITESATELAPFPGSTQGAASPVTVQADINSRGTLQLTSRARVVAGVQVQGPLTISSQDAHSVTAATTASGAGGQLTVNLASDAAQSLPSFSINPAPPGWLSRTASGAWQILRGFAEAIFPALAWIALFLASRAGVFGSVGRREPWRRAERIIGMVLLAHFVISAAVQISNLESGNFPGSLAIGNLSSAMIRAALWFPLGYAAVNGGVVLLIALIICAAGWWARPQHVVLRVPGGGIARIVTAVGIAFAVVGFAILAKAGRPQFFQSQFGQPQPLRGWRSPPRSQSPPCRHWRVWAWLRHGCLERWPYQKPPRWRTRLRAIPPRSTGSPSACVAGARWWSRAVATTPSGSGT